VTIEHRDPVVSGGDQWASHNLALSHGRCNQRRPRERGTKNGEQRALDF
jgi:hypothetical protein